MDVNPENRIHALGKFSTGSVVIQRRKFDCNQKKYNDDEDISTITCALVEASNSFSN